MKGRIDCPPGLTREFLGKGGHFFEVIGGRRDRILLEGYNERVATVCYLYERF